VSEKVVDAHNLAQFLEQHGFISEPQVVWIFIHILKDLEAKHDQGQLHLDIKPERIVRSGSGMDKLTGYGESRLGTARYISPERAQHQRPDARSDIYSLGAVLFEAVTGRPPFEGDLNYVLIDAHITKKPPLPRSIRPEVSAELQRIILTALAKDPRDRFQSAGEFRKALEGLANEQTNTAGEKAVRRSSGKMPEEKAIPKASKFGVKPVPKPEIKGSLEKQARVIAEKSAPTGAMIGPGVMSGKRPPPPDQARPVKKEKPAIAVRPRPTKAHPGPKKKAKVSPFVWIVPVAVVAVVIFLVLSARGMRVPKLTGMSDASAKKFLAKARLVLVVAGKKDDSLPAGTVVSQFPEPGTKVKKSDSVTVYISSGVVPVPEVVNLGLGQAREKLVQFGFRLGRIDSAYSDNYRVGRIFRTSPKVGTKMKPGSKVGLTVASGRATCPICGAKREPGAQYCTMCGYKFKH